MNKLDLSRAEDRTFDRILQRQCNEAGDTVFLITDDQKVTFAEADLITNSIAAGLVEIGVSSGDRVMLFMGNCPEMVLLALAVNKIGAIWTPINTEYKGEWLKDTVQRCRGSVLVVDENLYSRISPFRTDAMMEDVKLVLLGDRKKYARDAYCTYDELARFDSAPVEHCNTQYGDTCAILWTSGTTGRSKGVMQSYNAWIRAIVKGASQQYDSQQGDIIYCTLPLYNSGAWITSVLRALIEGIPVVIEKKFSVNQFWERIDQFRATQTFMLGAMGVFLLNAPEKSRDAETSLKTANIVPLPPQLWQVFESRFGVNLLRTGLGQSECLLVLTQLESRDDVPVYALGFPADDTDVCLLDDQGLEVPDGQVGEIAVRPKEPFVLFNGYFDDPEATKAAYSDDWYLTGDLGRRDNETGAFFFADRKKDAVRYAGRNISTLEVESVVIRHPAVQEVAAYGIPSEEVASEDELKIDVVLKDGENPSYESICDFISENAPYYFVPRYLEYVVELPYTPTKKVQKYLLRKRGINHASTWDIKNSNYTAKR